MKVLLPLLVLLVKALARSWVWDSLFNIVVAVGSSLLGVRVWRGGINSRRGLTQ
jgi:hypothetical protein